MKKRISKTKLYFVSFVIVVTTIFLIIWMTRKESLYEASRKIHHAVWDGNVRLLMNYMKDSEIELNQLTEDNLKKFCDNIFRKNLEGFTPDDQISFEMMESVGALLSSRVYKHPDGRVTALHLAVYKTDGKPIVGTLISQMLMTILYTQIDDRTKPMPSGKEQMLFHAQAIDKILSQLQNTGLPGLVREQRDGSYRLFTWDQFKHYWLELAQRETELKNSSFQR